MSPGRNFFCAIQDICQAQSGMRGKLMVGMGSFFSINSASMPYMLRWIR